MTDSAATTPIITVPVVRADPPPPMLGSKRLALGMLVCRGYRVCRVTGMRFAKGHGWLVNIKPIKSIDGDEMVVPFCELKRAR